MMYHIVALRKESVDRNLAVWAVEHAYQLSLSARRAWIEILVPSYTRLAITSLSARRAWIEIGVGLYLVTEKDMSLSARRAWIEIFV